MTTPALAPPGTSATSGVATKVGLAVGLVVGLLVSVPLWWTSGGTWMSVREFERWLGVVVMASVAMVGVGAALWATRRWHAEGSGVVIGTMWAALADLTWYSLAASATGD